MNNDTNNYYFLFHDNKIFLIDNNGKLSIPEDNILKTDKIKVNSKMIFNAYKNIPCILAEIENPNDIQNGKLFELRTVFGKIDDDFFRLALQAVHLFNWDKTSRFCGKCGSKTLLDEKLKAKKCQQCGNIIFPRISPAVIVAIEKDKKLLLAQGLIHEFHSLLAGFVETGENLEEAVAREVFEEAGIKIKNIKYFGSQPWPFPDSLMIGFTAEYESGEINIDKNELKSAGWFSVEEFPKVPGKMSIAGHIIDWFVNRK
jgi:NAD+ diphosphatase